MPAVNFRLPPTLHERFLKHLEDNDLKASDFLRDAVERFLDRVDDAPYTQTGYMHVLKPGERMVQAAQEIRERQPAGPKVRGFSALGGEPIMRSDGPLELPPKRGKK